MTYEEVVAEHEASSERFANLGVDLSKAEFSASIMRHRIAELVRAEAMARGEKVTEAKIDNVSRVASEVEQAYHDAAVIKKDWELARLALVRIESVMRHLE